MKELVFTRAGGRSQIMTATEGNLRFQLWPWIGDRWGASVFEITSGLGARRKTDDTMHASRAAAIDWLARYRQTETQETRA